MKKKLSIELPCGSTVIAKRAIIGGRPLWCLDEFSQHGVLNGRIAISPTSLKGLRTLFGELIKNTPKKYLQGT